MESWKSRRRKYAMHGGGRCGGCGGCVHACASFALVSVLRVRITRSGLPSSLAQNEQALPAQSAWLENFLQSPEAQRGLLSSLPQSAGGHRRSPKPEGLRWSNKTTHAHAHQVGERSPLTGPVESVAAPVAANPTRGAVRRRAATRIQALFRMHRAVVTFTLVLAHGEHERSQEKEDEEDNDGLSSRASVDAPSSSEGASPRASSTPT